MLNIITVDFEEWYHPEYVREKKHENKKDNAPQDLRKTLDLLEKCKTEATFFVVGEIAEKYPEFVNQIEEKGHEVAFHGYNHEPLTRLTAETLQMEINKFRVVMGRRCIGFRAPSFSLNNDTKWALAVLEKSEFKYDSSIFPASTPLYGVGNAPIQPYQPNHDDVSLEDEAAKLWEFPLHVSSHVLFRLPMAGGFYLRFFPIRLVARSIKKANNDGRPAVIFVHTWELNPCTPKQKLGLCKSFVTYHNLEETATRLSTLLSNFEFTSIEDYMKEKGLF